MSLGTEPPKLPRRSPRVAVLVLGGLMAVSMLAAAIGGLQGPVSNAPISRPVAVRMLRFADAPDHAVAVVDAATGRMIETIQAGEGNFVRALMRGLARQRVREGVGPEVEFILTAWEDGRLTLGDPATHRVVELEAFGPTNREDFARMLQSPGSQSPGSQSQGSQSQGSHPRGSHP
jgi:putative photosynthetic complex assembly protein